MGWDGKLDWETGTGNQKRNLHKKLHGSELMVFFFKNRTRDAKTKLFFQPSIWLPQLCDYPQCSAGKFMQWDLILE